MKKKAMTDDELVMRVGTVIINTKSKIPGKWCRRTWVTDKSGLSYERAMEALAIGIERGLFEHMVERNKTNGIEKHLYRLTSAGKKAGFQVILSDEDKAALSRCEPKWEPYYPTSPSRRDLMFWYAKAGGSNHRWN